MNPVSNPPTAPERTNESATDQLANEPAPAWPAFNVYGPTVITCAVVFYFTVGRGGGLFLALAIIPLMIWALVQALSLRRGRFKTTALKFLAWCCTLALVFGAHAYYRAEIRGRADRIVIALTRYKQQYGRYPRQLADIGVNESNLPPVSRISYGPFEQEPFVSYHSTFNPFDKYHYEFETHQWIFDPD